MSEYHRLVEQAARYAPTEEELEAAFALPTYYKELPDHACMEIGEETHTPEPYQVLVDDEDAFRQLLFAGAEVIYPSSSRSYIDYKVNQIIIHEGQHVDAARKIGSVAIWYGISVFWHSNKSTQESVLRYVPHMEHYAPVTTKLAAASVVGYPAILSNGDNIHISQFGYNGVQDLGGHVVGHNKQYRRDRSNQLLVPLSYTSEPGLLKRFFGEL